MKQYIENEKYLSREIIHEQMGLIANNILREILHEIREADMYTIIGDEHQMLAWTITSTFMRLLWS